MTHDQAAAIIHVLNRIAASLEAMQKLAEDCNKSDASLDDLVVSEPSASAE